ncbi:hypothetical protein D9611_003983 [Ephemerocybe angulata]|uniref:Uncharacterized protein n=1 Tax=Ephemerocybe angulata TaxID=980116 RepID=A0A8H5B5U4_9AGAR|nr:hypothetical protein D9611_003983 [Tulosesus angulatus]
MTSTTERVFSGDLGLRPTRSGRHNDSSSSRESSPDSDAGKRKRKRSFSPGSDFGEPEVPPVAQDDTPPPQERPLIRQAVGFGSAFAPSVAPPSSSIYQEPVSITPNAPLLPGQFLEVVKPPPKKTTSKKKKKADPYAGQSGRFRLEAYDATPAGAPPTQSGAGPYSSSFRATQPPAHRSESPAVRMEPYRYASTASETVHTQSERSISPPAPKPSRGSNKSKDSAKSRNRTTTQSQSRQPYVDAHTHSRVPSTTPAPASITDHGPSPPPPPSSGSRNTHYRRDYETGRKLQPSDLESTAGPSRSGRQSHSSSSPDLPTSSVPTSPNPNRGHSEGSNGNRKKQRNVKLVTIFAQDIRSGVVDDQLIEVMVPLRPPPDPSDGWFADAKDLIEQWQKSPSRIDGPARVYTMRGKYRQMLLRVSDSNVDDYTSTNVLVNGKLEVNVVIEDLPTPGQRPARPQVPLDLRPDDYEQDMRPPFPQPDVPPPRQQYHHDSARTGQPAYGRNDRDRQAQPYGSERYYDGPGPSGSSNQNTPSRSKAVPIGYHREEQTPSRSRHSPPASYHPEPSTPSRIRYSPPVPDREHHEKDPPFHARDLPPGPKEQPERNATPARPTRKSPPNSHREQDFQNTPTRPRREPLSADSRQGETIQPVPSARIVADVRSPEAGPSSAPPTNVSSDQLPVSAPLPEPQSYDLRGIVRKPRKGWESPIPGDAPEKVEEAILKAVDSMIQKDDKEKWKAFFKLKTRQETAANMVSMYQFVQDLIDKYVGLPVPFSSTSDHIMKTNHIIKVLMVEDEDGRYASNCEETLKLLRLYGKGGSRYEDPEVLKLLEETEVAYNSKPIKRLLHMLQNVDQRWKAEHPRT